MKSLNSHVLLHWKIPFIHTSLFLGDGHKIFTLRFRHMSVFLFKIGTYAANILYFYFFLHMNKYIRLVDANWEKSVRKSEQIGKLTFCE